MLAGTKPSPAAAGATDDNAYASACLLLAFCCCPLMTSMRGTLAALYYSELISHSLRINMHLQLDSLMYGRAFSFVLSMISVSSLQKTCCHLSPTGHIPTNAKPNTQSCSTESPGTRCMSPIGMHGAAPHAQSYLLHCNLSRLGK